MNRLLLILLLALVGCNRALPTTAPMANAAPVAIVNDANIDHLAVGKTDGKSDSPLFGGTPQRNMINTIDKNTPTLWNVEDGKRQNIKWAADLGNRSNGGPVIADGQVYVGTTNSNPRDKAIVGKKAVLMAFRESDGGFLWQIVHDIPVGVTSGEALEEGLCSTPAVEGKFIYYVTPGCEVVCADVSGKLKWTYDLNKLHKVIPHHLANCSPLVVGDLVMVITGNGTDEEGKITNPKAPSFVAINKTTGKLAWQSSLPGEKIIEGQWSNPTLATVNGKQQVIFAGGDCVLYALEPETGKLIWKCDCLPERLKKGERGIDNYMVATPAVVGDRLYVGLGVYPENPHPTRSSYFLCLDITKTGDVSFKNYNVKDAANKNSALVWAFGGMIDPPPAKGRQSRFGSTISTASVHGGLVFIPEERGYLHCLDAKTGQRYWEHDFKTDVWGSAYYVDGKVYLGTADGEVFIFAHDKERKWYVNGKLRAPDGTRADNVSSVTMDESIHSTAVVANGVLYIATKSKLYAIR